MGFEIPAPVCGARICGLGFEGRRAFVRDLSRLPSRAGDEARREARECVEGFAALLSLAVLAIVCVYGREVEKF